MEKVFGILLESGLDYLSSEELYELKEKLNMQGMSLQATKSNGPKAAFNDIIIFISQNTSELIIAGLIMPVVYDTLKNVIKFAVKKIKEKVKIVRSDRIREAQPCIKYKIFNCEIIAPIPTELSDEQFSIYFDSIIEAIKSIQFNEITSHEYFIVEKKDDKFKVEAKTMIQYAQEQFKEQQGENI